MSILGDVFGAHNNFQPTKPVNNFQATSPVQGGTLQQANSQAAGGAGPASGTIGRQNMLSDQLTAAAAGQGPSPAEAMLKQATSANINSATGQAASARGVNPALAMRTAVDNAATQNQGAAGQAATMKAGEQIAARQQLGTNLAQTGTTQLGQQQAGTSLLGAAGSLENQTQGINAGVAGQNAALDLGTQQLQAGIAGQNAGTNAGIAGGILNAGGSAMGIPFDEGGEVPQEQVHPDSLHAYLDQLHGKGFDAGGVASFDPEAAEGIPSTPDALIVAQNPGPAAPAATTSAGGSPLSSAGAGFTAGAQEGQQAFDRLTRQHLAGTGSIYAHGGKVPARVSPGEVVVPPKAAHDPHKAAQLVAHGKNKVPGQAPVAGDSPANDLIHARLAPGSVVIPRSITQGPNAAKEAASFVQSIMKRGSGKKYAVGGKVLRGPGPASQTTVPMEPMDLSGGGMVEGSHGTSTARGVGVGETRKRIKKSGVGKPKYSDDLAGFPGE